MSNPAPPVVPDGSIPPHAGERRFGPLEQRNFLRWVYVGRSILAALLLVRAALDRADAPETAFTAFLIVLLAYAVTGYGIYVSFVRKLRAGLLFLFCQAATDLLLVTSLVHVEGIQQTGWAALYVAVIS